MKFNVFGRNQSSKNLLKMSPFFLLFILLAAEDKGSLERGVFFHEETKILLAEIFVNVQFLVPYSKFDIQLTESLDKVATESETM